MKLKLAYIFTTFPKFSETFLQREIRSMNILKINFDIYSLWGGKKYFENNLIGLFPKHFLIFFPFYFIYWVLRKPLSVFKLLKLLFFKKFNSLENFGENLLGIIFGFSYAHMFKKKQYTHIHAAWASMPAMAALTIYKLTNIPFSMGAHAYDIFEHSGDTFLNIKTTFATFVHTSTNVAKNAMIARGINSNKIKMIRRGLIPMPQIKQNILENLEFIKIVSIGRLVEKKGYLRQLLIYKHLKNNNIKFKAKIIGDGPLFSKISNFIKKLGLDEEVIMKGFQEYNQIENILDWSNIFLFTGQIAKSGDRDGFPNVVGEAMARGVLIVSSKVSALPEVIKNNFNGFLIQNYDDNDEWMDILTKSIASNNNYLKIVKNARLWIEENFNAIDNAKKIVNFFNENL